MQIQKRWPALIAIGSVIAYLGNNYTIGGLEHLRLQPRRQGDSSTAISNSGEAVFGIGHSTPNPLQGSSGLWPSTGLPSTAIEPAAKTFGNNEADWSNKLGVGEKLAMIQEQLTQKFSDIASRTDSQVSASAALPLPIDVTRSTMGFGDKASGSSVASKAVSTDSPSLNLPPIMESVSAIRLASFNLVNLGATQLAKPHVTEVIISILRQFDVIAIQGIQSERDDILPILVERLNQSGRRFDYLIGPRVGQTNFVQQFAFLFDSTRIETDRYQLYTIDDPENLLTFEPLVGWFRCKDAKPEESFTFSLVNVRVNRSALVQEQSMIPNLFHAVANDGRQEDDLIIVGDFGGNPNRIDKLNSASVRFAIKDIPTDVSGSMMSDSILFPTKGTTEFSGRSGVYDFLRKHNLSLEQALEISSNLPVWAEFYALEGAHPGRVAPTNAKQIFQ